MYLISTESAYWTFNFRFITSNDSLSSRYNSMLSLDDPVDPSKTSLSEIYHPSGKELPIVTNSSPDSHCAGGTEME